MTLGAIDGRLLPRTAEVHATGVVIGGVDLDAAARTYGTPLFVYDEGEIRDRCREAVAAFPDGVAFASKSFLCASMARLVENEGMFIDVATEGEFDIVARAGVPASRVIVHGNNKSGPELTRAVDAGAHRIVVDNFDEIEWLRHHTPTSEVRCLVRVTPGVEAHTHKFVRTGHEDTKFGLSIATGDASRALDLLASMRHVEVLGVHAHIGSQIFDLEPFVTTIDVLSHFITGRDLREVCVGGGLGVPYVTGEEAPSISAWGDAVRASAQRHLPPGVAVTAEPGRAIVARAAVTIYRVGARKVAGGRTYLAVDGGMSDNPRPVLYGSGYEAFSLRTPLAARDTPFRIVGKHCESGDVLIDEAWLPSDVAVGDLIVTPVTGAYGYSMASTYNRTPRPAVVFASNGSARVVLRRETLDDLAALEPTP